MIGLACAVAWITNAVLMRIALVCEYVTGYLYSRMLEDQRWMRNELGNPLSMHGEMTNLVTQMLRTQNDPFLYTSDSRDTIGLGVYAAYVPPAIPSRILELLHTEGTADVPNRESVSRRLGALLVESACAEPVHIPAA